MAFLLGDIYIGNYEITQNFGAHPEVYSARFGLRGHNGIDIGCPSLTPILSANDGEVMEVGFDINGYGNYLKIKHNGYLTLYGHLNDFTVQKGDKVVKGQLIAHSDDSGFSDGPHLHFGVAPCDGNGVKTEANNGYSGYIDPMDTTRCQWEITNPTQPVSASVPVPSQELMDNVTKSLYAELVTKSNNWDTVAHDLNLADQDITSPDGASRVALPKIQALRDQITSLNRQLLLARSGTSPETTSSATGTTNTTGGDTSGTTASATGADTGTTDPIVPTQLDTSGLTPNTPFLLVLLKVIKDSIFVQKGA